VTPARRVSAFGFCVAALAAAAVAAGRAQSADPADERFDARPDLGLRVPVSFPPEIPVRARIALIEEASQIWQSTGIGIDWRPAGGSCEAGRCIRAIVARRPASDAGSEARTVGELVRLGGGGATVLLSLDEAERIVRHAPSRAPRPALLEGDPLGTVLGRAMAHELGHYFLDTGTHATHGLMRARFEPGEFTDPRSTSFALDAEAFAWVRGRIERALPVGPSVLAMPAVARAAASGGERLTFSYHR